MSNNKWETLDDYISPRGGSRRSPDDVIYSVNRSGGELQGTIKIGPAVAKKAGLVKETPVTLKWSEGIAVLEKQDGSTRKLRDRDGWLTLQFPYKKGITLPRIHATACRVSTVIAGAITFLLPEAKAEISPKAKRAKQVKAA